MTGAIDIVQSGKLGYLAASKQYRVPKSILERRVKSKNKWPKQQKASFYQKELQKTTQEIYRIEKIIRKRGKESLIKWLGYPDTFNSWVDNESLISA